MNYKVSIRELPDHRQHLLASIRRILGQYNSMDSATKALADRTMANLHTQLNQIDEFLCQGTPQ